MARYWLAAPLLAAVGLATAGCGSPASPVTSAGSRSASGPARATAADPPASATPGSPSAAASRAMRTSAPTPSVSADSSGSRSGGSSSGSARFWQASDSWPVPVTGTGGGSPYRTPRLGGDYGGYLGMGGNWARWLGCRTGNFLAWTASNARQAKLNRERYHVGIGTGIYWYMGGPGVDPHWNGGSAEARAWGARQAAQAIEAAKRDGAGYQVVFADIEFPGIPPAYDNGWSKVYTSPCSGKARSGAHVSAALARAEFNGFSDYLTSHSRYRTGVYSNPATWRDIFGTGSYSRIPHTYEWTYEPETASLRSAPRGWCLPGSGGCAEFFGGVTRGSRYAVAWQWSGGGGISNGVGDFDQVNGSAG